MPRNVCFADALPWHCFALVASLAFLGGTLHLHAQTWTPTTAPAKIWSAVTCSADGSKIVALANDGSACNSTNSGTDWTPRPSPVSAWGSAASSAGGDKLIALGHNITTLIYLSTNSGATWTPATAPATNWACVCCSTDGASLAAASQFGLVYISTNSGADWIPTTTPTAPWTGIASSADGQKILAVGSYWIDGGGSTVSASTDWGATWNNPPSSPLWLSVASSADGTRMVAGAMARVYTSVDLGISWSLTGLPSGMWSAVASSADGSRLAAAPNSFGGVPAPIYTSKDSGLSWAAAGAPGTNWSTLASSADGCFLVAAVGGFRRYPGLIYTWQCTPSPALSIATVGKTATLVWTVPSKQFVLQSNLDLATTNWTDVVIPPVLNYTNLQYEVAVTASNPATFYRLSPR